MMILRRSPFKSSREEWRMKPQECPWHWQKKHRHRNIKEPNFPSISHFSTWILAHPFSWVRNILKSTTTTSHTVQHSGTHTHTPTWVCTTWLGGTSRQRREDTVWCEYNLRNGQTHGGRPNCVCFECNITQLGRWRETVTIQLILNTLIIISNFVICLMGMHIHTYTKGFPAHTLP